MRAWAAHVPVPQQCQLQEHHVHAGIVAASIGRTPLAATRMLRLGDGDRASQQRIENPLSKLLLEGKFLPKSTIPADVDTIHAPGQFSFEREIHGMRNI